MTSTPGATIDGVEHHLIEVNGAELHCVTAGSSGSPILLVHGFPETWWAFHKVIPLLSPTHRVVAVDVRGFGDSSVADDRFDTATAVQDLHLLIDALGLGPVHLLGQDVVGGLVVRVAAEHPGDVRSLTLVESGLAGFGAEALADAGHGGAWYIGALVAPRIPELLFQGRERQFIAEWLYPTYGLVPPALTSADAQEFVRTYERTGGLLGAAGLYRGLLGDGEHLRALAKDHPIAAPALAVGSSGGAFTAGSLQQVVAAPVTSVQLDGVGHYVAMEAPERLAQHLLHFIEDRAGG